MALAETEIPRSCSILMKSDRVRRASPLARTWPAIWIAPPNSRNFSVKVVLPASGCAMMANVRRRAISGGRVGRLSSMTRHLAQTAPLVHWPGSGPSWARDAACPCCPRSGRYPCRRNMATRGKTDMDLGIRGKRALVCASSKGLGKGCAEALAEAGVDLILNARGAEALEATAAAIRARHNVNVTAIAADITTEDGRARVLDAAAGVRYPCHQCRRPAPRHVVRLDPRRFHPRAGCQHAHPHRADEGAAAGDDRKSAGAGWSTSRRNRSRPRSRSLACPTPPAPA